MKIEMREVKVMQEMYIADDGKEFDDYDECMDYESGLRMSQIKMYDFNRNTTMFVSMCEYVNLVTESDVDAFIYKCRLSGINTVGLDKPALYMWEGICGTWINLDQVMVDIRGGK